MNELLPLQPTVEAKTYDLRLTTFFFDSQREFNRRFMDVDSFIKSDDLLAPTPNEDPRVYWTLDLTRAALIETSELIYEMPWKHWQDYGDWEPRYAKIQEETIDTFNFIIGLGVSMGLSPEDVGPIEGYFNQHKSEMEEFFGGNPDKWDRAKVTLTNVDKLQNLLVQLRQNFPQNGESDSLDWKPDYESYINVYGEILSLFTKQCLVWDVDYRKLYEVYVSKRMKTVENIGNGYKWSPNINFED